jgi:hypothetical protein
MTDSQGSVNLDFLEGAFLGMPNTNVRSTVETPGIVILEILTFLAEELTIQPMMDISKER